MIRRHAALAALALSMTVAAGCGGSSDDTDSTTAPSTDTAAPDESAPSTETDAPDETGGANPGIETLVNTPDESLMITINADGTFSPSSIEVAAGEVFTFVAAEDASNMAVTFDGGASTYTVTGGLTESFTLETPGTYTVNEYLSENAMTVTVTG